MADLALNHRLAQGMFGGVVGGLDSLDIQEGPQRTCHLQELSAGVHCAGPRLSLGALGAQHHHLLEGGLECQANLPAAVLQVGPVDRAVFVAVPESKQLLLQAQQLCSEFSTGARAFSDGGEVADQVRPAELSLLQGEMVVGREVIVDHNPVPGVNYVGGRVNPGSTATVLRLPLRGPGRINDPWPESSR